MKIDRQFIAGFDAGTRQFMSRMDAMKIARQFMSRRDIMKIAGFDAGTLQFMSRRDN